MSSILKRFPTRAQILPVYAVIAFIVYAWALLWFFWKLPGWLYFLNIDSIFSALTYVLATNLLESVVVLCGPLALAVVLPSRWFRDVFVARGSSLCIAGLLAIDPRSGRRARRLFSVGTPAGTAPNAGLTWEQMDAIDGDDWSNTESLSPREKAAVEWAVAVTNGTARNNNKVFDNLKRYFTTRQIVEITFLCGMWTLSARLTEPFHLDVELPEDRIEFDGKRGRNSKASAA